MQKVLPVSCLLLRVDFKFPHEQRCTILPQSNLFIINIHAHISLFTLQVFLSCGFCRWNTLHLKFVADNPTKLLGMIYNFLYYISNFVNSIILF